MGLSRTSGSGLLDRNEGNASFPYVASEWDSPAGWGETVLSHDLILQSSGNHAPGWSTRNIANQSEMMIYASIDPDNVVQVGVGVLISNNAAGTQDGIEGSIRAPSSSGTRQLRRWDAGAATTIDSTGSRTAASPVRMSLWADDTDCYLYDHNNAEFESGTYPSPKTGRAGVYIDYSATGQQVNLSGKIFIFTGRYIRVTGLSGGMIARLRNGSGATLAEATEVAGTATIDCITVEAWDNIGDLRVVSSGEVVLAEETGDVWAGETWDYAASAGAPDTPTISATALGSHSAKSDGSVYSHPDEIPLKAINWQAATDAAFTLNLIDTEYEYDDPDDAPDPPVEFWDLEIDGTDWYFRVRYKAVNDVYSAFSSADSVTLPADDPLTTPSIPTAVPTPTTVKLTGSAFADPEDPDRTHTASQWQVDESGGDYSTPVADSLEDPINKTEIVLGGLTAGTNYIARVRYRADDGTWSSYSANKTFSTPSTPADRPAEPVIDDPVSDLTSTSFRAVVSAYSDPTGSPHKQTQWFLLIDDPSNVGFPNFAAGWGSFYLNTSPVTTRTFSGLQQGRTYGLAVRYQAFDGDWSDWSDFLEIDLPTDPLGGKALRILTPHHGRKSNSTYTIRFSPDDIEDTLFEADYARAENINAGWTNIFTDVEGGDQIWNVSTLDTDWYVIRLKAYTVDTETPYEYRLVYVDQEGIGLDNASGTPEWENSLNETDITWTPRDEASDWKLEGGAGISDGANLIAAKLRTDIGPFRSFDMACSFAVGSSGGPFIWARFPEQVWRGPCWALKESEITGVVPYAGIFVHIYSVPINAIGDGALTRGTGPLFLQVQGWDEFLAGVGGHQFLSFNDEIGTHHFIDNFNISGVVINKYPEYGARMRVTTLSLNPENGKRTIRLQIAIYGRGVEPPADGWHLDMAVETNIFCAYCGDSGRTITQTRDPYGDFFGMTVVPIVACSEDAPIEGGDAPEEAEDVGETISSTGSGKQWSVDLPRFHKTGVGYWHRRSHDSSRPAVVDTRYSTFVGLANQVYRVVHDETIEGYWTSPTLNRKNRINDVTLSRVILRYESADSVTPVIEASSDGGATWTAGLKATVTGSTTSGTSTKRMIQSFNVTGPDLRFRITFPADVKLLVHSARAEILERGKLGSE